MGSATETPAVGGSSRPPNAAFSVIVPVRNGGRTLARTLAEIERQVRAVAPTGEIVVVDDASTDNTAEVLAAVLRRSDPTLVRSLRRATRGGSNASRNTGVHAATGSWLVFVDGDDTPLEGWLAALLTPPLTDDVIVGGTYVLMHGRRQVGVVLPESRRSFGFPYAVGGNMAFSRRLYEAVGGFDEVIVRGGTEVDFSIRAQVNGFATVRPEPAARVEHSLGHSHLARARTHFHREQGHLYIAGKLAPLLSSGVGPPSDSAVAADPRWTPDGVKTRSRLAGGVTYAVAERLGTRLGRLYYGSLRARPRPRDTTRPSRSSTT